MKRNKNNCKSDHKCVSYDQFFFARRSFNSSCLKSRNRLKKINFDFFERKSFSSQALTNKKKFSRHLEFYSRESVPKLYIIHKIKLRLKCVAIYNFFLKKTYDLCGMNFRWPSFNVFWCLHMYRVYSTNSIW